MEPLKKLLKKKFSQPAFKKALLFGRLKELVESFFLKKNLRVFLIELDDKNERITLKTSHPSIARETLGYQESLNEMLKREKFTPLKKIRIVLR